jgi:ribosomal protein L37E
MWVPRIDPLQPAAVFAPSDRSTLELDLRRRCRANPRWRRRSFAELADCLGSFWRRTSASDGHELALPTHCRRSVAWKADIRNTVEPSCCNSLCQPRRARSDRHGVRDVARARRICAKRARWVDLGRLDAGRPPAHLCRRCGKAASRVRDGARPAAGFGRRASTAGRVSARRRRLLAPTKRLTHLRR